MFSIEVKFKVAEREVTAEMFAASFLTEILKTAQIQVRPEPIATVPPKAVEIPHPKARVVSVPEAAQILGIKAATIRRYILERKIACIHIGRLVRIPLEVVDELLERGLRPARK